MSCITHSLEDHFRTNLIRFLRGVRNGHNLFLKAMAPSVENLHIPHLDDILGSKRLIVDGNPFLMLAAELQNSSMTSATYMSNVWADLAAANINTVLGCVTWQSIEREEGKFDFAELDRIIADARGHGLKLVLLWFGSFKNGLCTLTRISSWYLQDREDKARSSTYSLPGPPKLTVH